MHDINLLQTKFRHLLETFMSGGLMSKGFQKFYPFQEGIDLSYIDSDIKFLCKSAKVELDINYIKSEEDVANIISNIYCSLFKDSNSFSYTEKSQFNLQKYKPNNKIKKIEKFLLNNEVLEYVDLIAMQGSYASNDFLENISDVDLFVVLTNETLFSGKKIYKLKVVLYESMYYFYNIDPHQHHGYFLFTPYDLNNFPELFLPLKVLQESKLICGKGSFLIQKRSCIEESFHSYEGISRYLRKYSLEEFERIHDFKLYFQVIQLLPISILQTKGFFIDKRNSFIELKKISNIQFDIFDYCFELRSKWKVRAFRNNLFSDMLFYVFRNPKLTYYMNQIFFRDTPVAFKEFANKHLNKQKVITTLEQSDKFINGGQ